MEPRILSSTGQYIPHLRESFIGIELRDYHNTYRATHENTYDFYVKEIAQNGELKGSDICVSKNMDRANFIYSKWTLVYSPYKDATDCYDQSTSETTQVAGRGKILNSQKVMPTIIKGSIPSGRVIIGKSIKSLISSESMRGKILTD